MGQPVRKTIKETHPDINIKPFYTLLVDGNNLLRICFRDEKINSKGIHYGGVFQFLLQLKIMLMKKDFDYIYVTFDNHNSGVLRYKIYNDYKANRDKTYSDYSYEELSDYQKAFDEKLKKMQNYYFKGRKDKKNDIKVNEREYIDKFKVKEVSENIIFSVFGEERGKKLIKTAEKEITDENFARERDILLKYFNELYIRWIFHETVEGDDFIAYYVQHKKPEERIVIMSSDQDLTQLISDTVCVYDHSIDKFISKDNIIKLKGIPVENVLIEKIFCGDTSDNIKNISGVSKARLHELIPEIEKRPITIEEVKERAQKCIDERIAQKKKPLKWHENIVNGVCNGNYNGDFYEINKKIIDLSNPLLTDDAIEEIDSMMYNVQDIEGRSFANLYNYIVEDGIDELKNESKFASFFEQFKILADKEIKRYKKEFLDF